MLRLRPKPDTTDICAGSKMALFHYFGFGAGFSRIR
jgi:hypothetical protein